MHAVADPGGRGSPPLLKLVKKNGHQTAPQVLQVIVPLGQISGSVTGMVVYHTCMALRAASNVIQMARMVIVPTLGVKNWCLIPRRVEKLGSVSKSQNFTTSKCKIGTRKSWESLVPLLWDHMKAASIPNHLWVTTNTKTGRISCWVINCTMINDSYCI